MKRFKRKHIALGVSICILSIFCFSMTLVLAQESRVSGLNVVSSSGTTLEARIYNYTTQTYDNKITWSNADLSQPQGWVVADQCLEIAHSASGGLWGIQIYTDNENNTLPGAKAYTGNIDPAGLIGQATTDQALSMAWIADAGYGPGGSLPDEPAERPYGPGFVGGRWHWLKDINTPDDPDTEEIDECFQDGMDYVTIWNQRGVALGDEERASRPDKLYVFLAADFTAGTKQSYKTNSLTVEHYREGAVSNFPFAIYKDGPPSVQMAYEHISSKMDMYFGGSEKRFIESYSEPYPPEPANPTGDLEGTAFSYDNALAISAYLARPTDENLFRAKLLCKAFIAAQTYDNAGDGRIRDAYNAKVEIGNTHPDIVYDSSTTGNISWTICALMQYYKNSGDTDVAFLTQVLNSAIAAGEYIHSRYYDSSQSGYRFGNLADNTIMMFKSAEHNIAAYVAFSHLYDITGDNTWLVRANNAKSFVDNIAWRSGEKRYICGTDENGNPNTGVHVADTNTLANIAMGSSSRNRDAMDYVLNTFYFKDDWTGLEGIDYGFVAGSPATEPDGIWYEGTAQFAAAYKVAGAYGSTDNSQRWLQAIKEGQHRALNSANANYKAIVAASKGDLTTGFGWYYHPTPHVAATAWYAATSLDYNMLWGTSLNQTVPSPGDNNTFTADPDSLEVDNEYMKNHYYPSGWMNTLAGANLQVDTRCTDNPHSGQTCFKITWNGQDGDDGWNWAGLVWQEPQNQWEGAPDKGYDLSGADYLSFWARADSGSIGGNKPLQIMAYFGYSSDSCGETPPMWRNSLTTEWQQYVVPVLNRDMSYVSNGFGIIFNEQHTPNDTGCTIYIDDVEFKRY
ncbi:MAG: hypothetical protein HQ558_05515 [Candidatus Omnitrophica bacterium]|nr:hypothetical protein [Candidatus Omnitrophota bacterium]